MVKFSISKHTFDNPIIKGSIGHIPGSASCRKKDISKDNFHLVLKLRKYIEEIFTHLFTFVICENENVQIVLFNYYGQIWNELRNQE